MANILYIQCLPLNIYYQHPVSQIRNISVLQKLHLKIASETTQEIFAIKSMLAALNFLNICEN